MKKVLLSFLAGVLIILIPSALALSTMFSDVSEDEWYSGAVTSLSDKSIIEGYEDGTFRPTENVNRAELAVIIDRLIDYDYRMDINCDKLSAYQDYFWFDTLVEKYKNQDSGNLSGIAEDYKDIVIEYGRGCSVAADGYFVFMSGNSFNGCHEIFAYDIHHEELANPYDNDSYFCVNELTNLTSDYISFIGMSGPVCQKDEGRYYFKENRVEFTTNPC